MILLRRTIDAVNRACTRHDGRCTLRHGDPRPLAAFAASILADRIEALPGVAAAASSSSTPSAPRRLHDKTYRARRQAESLIKARTSCASPHQTSCSKPTANQPRLLVHTVARRLLRALRSLAPKASFWRQARSTRSASRCSRSSPVRPSLPPVSRSRCRRPVPVGRVWHCLPPHRQAAALRAKIVHLVEWIR